MISQNPASLRFFVFNPLSWTRTDIADLPYSDTGPIHVIDLSTGLEAPSQVATIDGQRCLRVLAENIPSIGYKVYEIRQGAASSFSDAAIVSGNIIENDHDRITVADRGAITSLIDKTRYNREFVRQVNDRFINDLGQALGTLEVENAGPVSVTLLATSSSPLAHATRITLIRNSRRIDIRNDINQNFSGTYTWGFGFNLDTPEIWHEEVGAIVLAKLLAEGGITRRETHATTG